MFFECDQRIFLLHKDKDRMSRWIGSSVLTYHCLSIFKISIFFILNIQTIDIQCFHIFFLDLWSDCITSNKLPYGRSACRGVLDGSSDVATAAPAMTAAAANSGIFNASRKSKPINFQRKMCLKFSFYFSRKMHDAHCLSSFICTIHLILIIWPSLAI